MGLRAMASQRHQKRVDRWAALSGSDMGLAVLGVAGKSAVSAGLLVLFVGLLASPLAGLVGGLVVVLGLAAWWGSARAIGVHAELSTGRVMWMTWCIPTWSALGDLFDAF